ncbi:hypothetical protein Tco_0068270 [Tanacetum coccineum]
MAVLKSCPKHNMVAYLEKTDGNTEFHEIISFLTQSSIHYALTVRLKMYLILINKKLVLTDQMKEEVSTDRPDEGTIDQTEGRSATLTTPTPTPTIFRDDKTIAQVLLNIS